MLIINDKKSISNRKGKPQPALEQWAKKAEVKCCPKHNGLIQFFKKRRRLHKYILIIISVVFQKAHHTTAFDPGKSF